MKALAGRILHVDLTNENITIEEPGEDFYRKYMGGSAMGMYYALREIPKGADPLGPDNVLILSLGPATGLPISGQSRVTATARSPLTDAIGDSQAGGFWPAEFRRTGFDAIVIKGEAAEPVYLWIHDGEAELRDASALWGKVTGEVEAMVKEELDEEKIEILQTGPAGERGVRFSCLINMCNRANGRTGMGAVMGAKNLKAVVVKGRNQPQAADKEKIRDMARHGARNVEERVGALAKFGTANTVGGNEGAGGLPTRNFTSGHFEGAEKIDGPTMYDTVLKERDTCYGCAVRCKRVVELNDEYDVDPLYGGPEYETLAALGSYCGVDDLAAVCKANEICNMYGMDTISCGGTVAWAMECYENGILTDEDTDGLELRFGNASAMVETVRRIATGEGYLGQLLGQGSERAAAELGQGSEAFLTTCKKQEMPAHMPRVKRTLGLIYSVNPFGADHMSSDHDPNYELGSYAPHKERLSQLDLKDPQPAQSLNAEKVRFALYTEWAYSCLDTVNVCQFCWGPSWQLYSMHELAEMISAATGWDVSLYELMKLGERRLNMLRAFNLREGIDRQADTPPKRLFEPLQGGISDGWAMEQDNLGQAFETYYAMAGWDSTTGGPTRAKLAELGIEWVADEIGL
jgi:aldehyde:ferredoxin oxidoreductase